MTQRESFVMAKTHNGECYAILQVFRLLTAEEQRIAYAIQKALDSQEQSQPSA